MSVAYLIVGLGNPGSRYAETRHNAGFWFLDRLALASGAGLRGQPRLNAEVARTKLSGHDCILAKPTVFMNHSGQAVRAVMDYYGLAVDRLLVAYDELDLPAGIVRLKQGGGHGGHNGLRDIFRHVSDHDFLRLRIGIGHPGDKDAVTAYVLGRPSVEQERSMQQAITESIETLPMILGGDVAGAMKTLHTVRTDGL
ncbi:MAG: aminoacyl-tRNA hydrolase [Xanthomonadales bacterium]|nr:aminoacyl-tRNA hydrolase [Xanthomonadales bacterium]